MINRQPVVQNPNTFLKTTSVIHLALIAGQIIFAATAFMTTKNHATNKSDDVFIYVAPIMAVTGFAIGSILFKTMVNKIDGQSPLKTKLAAYQSALIVRFALLEGPSLFAIVSFMLTGNLIFLGISGAIIACFIYLRPTKQKIEDDLSLGYEEKAELDGTDKAY
ncbi:hypothetical protein SAMN05192574_10564 [Mucilaginibacter gossypiicola]|uniref:Uncharacterized protein n=1 Tax=Mucilaginibacter gossypiicola TaxID=551995 RepID=A0A1H8LF19_9SPHI|nr:hypothetical protein [Mucilaginibacter gossypiicola]SEO03649.1 hypothetical protein SAMN05192574_10564 [Mucilaginibacter gossypiicola]